MTKQDIKEELIKAPCGKYPMTFSQFWTMYKKAKYKNFGRPTYYFTSGRNYDNNKNRIDLVTLKIRNKELFLFIEELEDSERSAFECCSKIQECMTKDNIDDCFEHISEFWGIPQESLKDYKIIPSIIVFEGSRPSKEFKDKSNKELQKVVKKLGIKVIHANWSRYFPKNQIMGGLRYLKQELINKMEKCIYSDKTDDEILDFFEYYTRTKDTDEYYQELFIKCLYEAHDCLKDFFDRVNGVRLNQDAEVNKNRMKYVLNLFRNNSLKKDLGKIVKILGKPKNSLTVCSYDIPFVTYNEATNELFFVSTIYRNVHYSSFWFLFSFYNCWDNINQDELIEKLVKSGKIPTADVKTHYAVVVDKNVYPGIELKDNTREQLQNAVEELEIKIYYH